MDKIYIGNTGETPLGDLWVAVSEKGLVSVEFQTNQHEYANIMNKHLRRPVEIATKKVGEAVSQLREYLAGKRRDFNLPVDWSVLGDFQCRALQATCKIPYGQTRTYGQIAGQIGRPRASRAVGRAEATNPMPLVIPCHRVVGADGKLHGYGGPDGVKTKEWLLNLEKGGRKM